MARPKTIVTKSELAGILGLSKGRISQLSQREDFPSRPDGRINRNEAVAWYKSTGLADRRKRGPKAKVRAVHSNGQSPAVSEELAQRLAAENYSPEIDLGARNLYETLIAASGRIPEVLCELGCRDAVILAVVQEAFVDFIFALAPASSDAAYDWAGNDDHGPVPEVDLQQLAQKYGFTFDPEAIRTDYTPGRELSAAERILERLDELVWMPATEATE